MLDMLAEFPVMHFT